MRAPALFIGGRHSSKAEKTEGPEINGVSCSPRASNPVLLKRKCVKS